MGAVLAALLAVEESGESGSGGSVVFWLIGTCWGVWFLRRRRHLGRISAFLLCFLIWPLLVVWALGRVVFRRKGAKGRVERDERKRHRKSSAAVPKPGESLADACPDLAAEWDSEDLASLGLRDSLGSPSEIDVESFTKWVSEKSETDYLERRAEIRRGMEKIREMLHDQFGDIESLSDAEARKYFADLRAMRLAEEKQPPISKGISSWQDAEVAAVECLHEMGYQDVKWTGRGADKGIDAESEELAVQVKRWKKDVGRPEIQKLLGAAHGKRCVFFAVHPYENPRFWKVGCPFTKPALEEADETGVALFGLLPDRTAVPHNRHAEDLY